MPEITHHCPKTPFLLVGTQIDLRDDPSTIEKLAKNKQKPITPETAEKLARDLKAVKYVECSALTQVRTVRSPMSINSGMVWVAFRMLGCFWQWSAALKKAAQEDLLEVSVFMKKIIHL